MRQLLHAWYLQLVDELAANYLLHQFLWYRRRPPARGPRLHDFPALFSGELETFYAPGPSPVDLDALKTRDHETAHAVVGDYRFISETTTGWPDSDLVWGRHWQSKHPDRHLTVVGVDGIVQFGHRWFRRLAALLNPRGIDVMTMDVPFNFRRTPRGFRPGQLIVGGDMGHQLSVSRQAVLDLWRVVLSLQRAGRRVGLVGVSYGGWLSLMTSLLADDLEFVIALVPPVDIVGMLRAGGTIVRAVRRGLGRESLDKPEFERVARPVIPGCWPNKLTGSRISLHAARYDRLAPCHAIESLANRWKTKFTVHPLAHFHLANSARVFPEIADEVCEFAAKFPGAPLLAGSAKNVQDGPAGPSRVPSGPTGPSGR